MNRTVLLINPPIYDFAAYDFFNKPLGLLYLAAFLRQAGYQIRYLDCLDRRLAARAGLPDLPASRANGTGKYYQETLEKPNCLRHLPRTYRRYGLPQTTLAELLQAERPHEPLAVLVTSMMTYWYPAVADTIKLVRSILPGVPVALGGVYARLMPEHARNACRPDRLFAGPALTDALRWLDELSRTRRDYHSIQDDFLHWPAPAYDLYPELEYLTLISSLGCPFHCDYCASRRLQPRLIQLEPEAFLSQLHALLELLTKRTVKNTGPFPNGSGPPDAAASIRQRINLAFMDDALLAGAENHIIPILKQTRRIDLPLRFHCPNGLHCRFVGPELAELMHANRFEMIRLSFESSDAAARWQKAGDHKTSERDLVRAVENLERAGYRRADLEGYVLTGLPGQSYDEISQSAQFVHDLGIRIRLCEYSPIAHTPLFELSCREYGVDPAEPLLHNNSILPTLDRRMSPADYQRFKDTVQIFNLSLTF
ncbi:MAG: cobalamin-dependent protein [Sedimentisphaerales bacterium]|nr:cobalamin-dependent protein [Sedimentisphaerales bacterium]